MKKFLFIIFVAFFIYACSSDSTSPTGGGMMEEEESDECDGTSFTYTDNVAEIINSSCALSGCHVSGNSQGLPNFTTFQNVFDRRSNVSSRVNSGNMPPSGSGITLTDAQKRTIVCWVKAGAPQ